MHWKELASGRPDIVIPELDFEAGDEVLTGHPICPLTLHVQGSQLPGEGGSSRGNSLR